MNFFCQSLSQPTLSNELKKNNDENNNDIVKKLHNAL